MDIYQQQIIEHYKNPHNKKVLLSPTFQARQVNSLCGDEIEVFLITNGESITDIGFTGQGCAISQASASMFTDYIKGKTLKEVRELPETIIYDLLGFTLTPARQRCALLAFQTVQQALH